MGRVTTSSARQTRRPRLYLRSDHSITIWIFSNLSKAGMVVLAGCVAISAVAIHSPVSAAEQKTNSNDPVIFNIPSQPLADARVAYGAATGLEVYYDGALALGRHSAGVRGSFPPMQGLEVLLQGTGYWPRATSPDTFTLVPVQQAQLPARLSQSGLRQHEQYFAVAKALCDKDSGTAKQIIFSFWVTRSGTVYQARMLNSDGSASTDAAIIERINKVAIGTPPPGDVPQPITMAVYPPSRGDVSGCLPTSEPETGR